MWACGTGRRREYACTVLECDGVIARHPRVLVRHSGIQEVDPTLGGGLTSVTSRRHQLWVQAFNVSVYAAYNNLKTHTVQREDRTNYRTQKR